VTTHPIQARTRSREPIVDLDRHWLDRLHAAVGRRLGADWTATISSLVTCAVWFGFSYLLFLAARISAGRLPICW
jgi:hypothetical protein